MKPFFIEIQNFWAWTLIFFFILDWDLYLSCKELRIQTSCVRSPQSVVGRQVVQKVKNLSTQFVNGPSCVCAFISWIISCQNRKTIHVQEQTYNISSVHRYSTLAFYFTMRRNLPKLFSVLICNCQKFFFVFLLKISKYLLNSEHLVNFLRVLNIEGSSFA